MARENIVELTDEQVLSAFTDRFFRRVQAKTPDIPATYAGKYVSAVLVATDAQLSEAQMDALETSIEAISGVHKAFCLIGPARIPLDRVPTGDELRVVVEAGFDIYTPDTP
jgi:hypothetical protein